jgi:D-alanyl-D-alanine carboxypeptidase (penicillin-binding protein 5/6)
LLFRDKTIDGVKTGHTEEAGYCLVASSEKEGMRLISVVMGTSSDNARAQETQKLLAYGFRYYHTHKLYEKNATVSTVRVWKGQLESIDLGVTKDIYLTVPRGSEDKLIAKASVDNIIEAPITINQELGSVIISLEGETLLNAPLVSLKAVEEAGLFIRIYDGVALFFHRFTVE